MQTSYNGIRDPELLDVWSGGTISQIENLENNLLLLIRQKVTVSPALLIGLVANEVVDEPLIDTGGREAGNEAVP